MTIRVATPEDARALGGLVLAFRDHLGAKRPSEAEVGATLPRALQDPSVEFYLAVSEDGDALGYAQCRFFLSVWAAGWEGHLEDVFVVPEARRRGMGGRLLALVLERAASRGVRSLGLHTNENNTQAHALYRRLGFAPRTEPRWQDGVETYWTRRID